MNERTTLLDITRKVSFTAALVVALLASACALKTGRFLPTTANHPASPDAEEAGIEDPGRSLATSTDPAPAAAEHSQEDREGTPSKTRYVCPMHPDVGLEQPGKCPRCGMALEERKPEASEGHHHDR